MRRTFLKDERGQFDVLFILALLFFGAFALLVGVILLLAPIALFLYIWRIIYPFGRSIAEWTTHRRNVRPFVIFMLIVIVTTGIPLIIWLLLSPQYPSLIYLILPLSPIFAIAVIIFSVALGLAIILWLVRLCRWAFARFRRGFLRISFRIER